MFLYECHGTDPMSDRGAWVVVLWASTVKKARVALEQHLKERGRPTLFTADNVTIKRCRCGRVVYSDVELRKGQPGH